MKRLVFLTVLFLVGESFASENSNKYLDRLERMEEPSKSIVRLTALLHPQRFVRIVCLGNHGTIAKREVDKIKRTPLHSPMVLQRLLDEIKEEESKLIPTYQTNAWLVHYYSRELGLSDILSTSKNELLYGEKIEAATKVASKSSFKKCFVHYELLKRAMKYAVYCIIIDQIKECKEYYDKNPSHRATDEGLDSLVVSRHSSQNSFSCL